MAEKKGLTEKSAKVFAFVKDTAEDSDLTLHNIADALEWKWQSVNGCLNGLAKRGLIVREEAEVMDNDGKATTVKYIRITDAGKEYTEDEGTEEE